VGGERVTAGVARMGWQRVRCGRCALWLRVVAGCVESNGWSEQAVGGAGVDGKEAGVAAKVVSSCLRSERVPLYSYIIVCLLWYPALFVSIAQLVTNSSTWGQPDAAIALAAAAVAAVGGSSSSTLARSVGDGADAPQRPAAAAAGWQRVCDRGHHQI
jgi:hypothetical protein